ncbi:MAG TPA: hypothetical protein DCZ43_06445 [candidate division Zixibacteria bacterium]|nr:hypothetical protein [candidate division Zixibacteria bacterium]
MGIPGIFKQAGKLKKKTDQQAQKGEQVDHSIFRIGVYGHKGVGKTVFFTIAYMDSKRSPDFEIMALGETQEILEEKYNLMRGQGMDIATGQKISTRRFPPLSTGEQKLDFEVRTGRNTIIPINTIDYSGELIYIDARGDLKQNLIDFFKGCECILFFIDPDAIQNEGERSNRVAAFTDLISQLSGFEKRLKIPVGLVVSKADELPGFKSAEQSILINKGNGYIRALNFSGFLRGVLKQRVLANRPDWKNELEQMLNRLESFFKPLLNRTLDYQVFFISSTGNAPQVITDPKGDRVKVPPEDLRPLGVSQPLMWAIQRIAAYRRAAAFKNVLKWTLLVVALVVDLVAFGQFYNQLKVKNLKSLVENESRDVPGAGTNIAKHYDNYANNIIIKTFFGDFSKLAQAESKYYRSIGDRQTQKDQQDKFGKMLTEIDRAIAGLGAVSSDSAKFDAAKLAIQDQLGKADTLANSFQGTTKTDMIAQINLRRDKLKSVPSGGAMVAAQNLRDQYETFRKDFLDNLAIQNYDYLLGMGPDQFPTKLKTFKDSVLGAEPDNTAAVNYSHFIQTYLNAVSAFETGVLVPFRVEGATGGEGGYSLFFNGAKEAPEGEVISSGTGLQFRLPITQQFNIDVHKGGKPTSQSYPVGIGYTILKLNNQRIKFVDPNINIRLIFDLERSFLPLFKDKL